MRFMAIPKASVVRRFPHLYPGIPGAPNTEQRVGLCVNARADGGECGNPVWAGRGFADLDGRPFRAYYCERCAAALVAAGRAQQLEAPPPDEHPTTDSTSA